MNSNWPNHKISKKQRKTRRLIQANWKSGCRQPIAREKDMFPKANVLTMTELVKYLMNWTIWTNCILVTELTAHRWNSELEFWTFLLVSRFLRAIYFSHLILWSDPNANSKLELCCSHYYGLHRGSKFYRVTRPLCRRPTPCFAQILRLLSL